MYCPSADHPIGLSSCRRAIVSEAMEDIYVSNKDVFHPFEELTKMNPEQEPKKLYRRPSDQQLGGVCSGLAEYFKIDSSLIRITFAVLALAGGPGLLLYLLLWAIVPEKKEPEFDDVIEIYDRPSSAVEE